MMERVPPRLTTRSLRAASHRLAERDPTLGASIARFGPPPLWAREPGFPALVHMILEQQVSLASAQAAFDRLSVALVGRVTPHAFLGLTEDDLRAIGFSRQKAGYARGLAAAALDGFDLPGLAALDDDEVRTALTSLRGIGRWTADVYLTMCLLRPGGARPRRAAVVRRPRAPGHRLASVPGCGGPDPVARLPADPRAPRVAAAIRCSRDPGGAPPSRRPRCR
jgi:DNA-3-methyladenine glycosylase II